MHSYTVEPLYVKSDHEVIAADFYRPKSIEKPAVILMAHGLAALRHLNWCNTHSILLRQAMRWCYSIIAIGAGVRGVHVSWYP